MFVDKGGVLVDNTRLGPEWRRLLGQVLPRLLGGDPERWREANDLAERTQAERWRAALRTRRNGVADFFRDSGRQWLLEMCDHTGVTRPNNERADQLVREVVDYVTRRVDAKFPDTREALERIRSAGIVLHTASGDESADLEGYLHAVGVRDLFDRLYGSDLVDRFKNGPHFYQAILEDASIAARHAAVVNDGERALDWAGGVGLRTFHFVSGGVSSGRHEVVHSLSDLADQLT